MSSRTVPNGELVHSYSAWKGEGGYADMYTDGETRYPKTSFFIPVFLFFLGFFLLLSCIYCCVACQRRQRLWSLVNANPSVPAFEIYPPVARPPVARASPNRPAFQTYPPVAQQQVRTPAANNYSSSDYTRIGEPNSLTTNRGYRLNYDPVPQQVPTPVPINDGPPSYTAVVEPYPTAPPITREELEAPPPAYTTVAPLWLNRSRES